MTPKERKAYDKIYRKTHKEKVTTTIKAWREANKEKVKTTRKAWCEANKGKTRAHGWKAGGIDPVAATALMLNVRWCEICLNEVREKLQPDHKHGGGLRGALCPTCNRGIGLLQDSPTILQAAANYLNKYQPH